MKEQGRRSIRRTVLAALTCFAMAAGGLTAAVLSAAPANAWSTTDFDAGNIVDDVLFYDGDAMTTAQVQSFLNDRVTRCSSGSTCLRDYTITTSSQAASSYCKAYAGAKNEKAAAIIAKVGKACGISQRVLLIMLQKEQSLVTDTSPSAQQYFRAMGYACPDSGPGGSANCDASQGGFYKQVYRAAWQLKVYKARPNDYRYRPFQKNTIQYSVPLNCGTSTVSIENWATAALYIYTPYRPNKAALAAGWGTGDGCSTYGNRNFFNFWNQWFGPVRAELQMTGAIKKVYDAAEAAGTPYGDPVAARQKITANGGGYQMVFEKGVITQSTALGKTFGLRDPSMFKAYVDLGGASSAWGFLASNPSGSKVADRDNRRLTLQNGTLVHSTVTAGVGIRFMPTAVAAPWLASGAQAGPFGFPNANAAMKTSVAGSQRFIGGTMMVSGSRSTLVSPTDAAKWQTLGGYDALGFYTADPVIIGDRSYRLSQKGAVFFLSATKQLFLADNAITRSYLAGKGPAGKLGWPTAGVRRHSSGGLSQRFENFAAVYAASTGVRSLSIPAYNDWLQRGAEKSALGYPNADTRRLSDGEYQRYPGYTVFYGPVRTSTLSNDLIVTDYLNRGGPASRWGWPSTTSTRKHSAGGLSLRLQRGAAVYSKTNGLRYLSALAYDNWLKRGAEKSTLGFPTQSTKQYADGSSQGYKKYIIFYGPRTTLTLKTGSVTKAYLAAGGPQGKWGWPIAAPKTSAKGTITVKFSKGKLTIPKKGRIVFK